MFAFGSCHGEERGLVAYHKAHSETIGCSRTAATLFVTSCTPEFNPGSRTLTSIGIPTLPLNVIGDRAVHHVIPAPPLETSSPQLAHPATTAYNIRRADQHRQPETFYREFSHQQRLETNPTVLTSTAAIATATSRCALYRCTERIAFQPPSPQLVIDHVEPNRLRSRFGTVQQL